MIEINGINGEIVKGITRRDNAGARKSKIVRKEECYANFIELVIS